eukprot:279159-Heterocapsa_arctica.AAC.1
MRGIQKSGQRWASWFPWSSSSQCGSDAHRIKESDDEVKNEAVKKGGVRPVEREQFEEHLGEEDAAQGRRT